MKLGKYLPICLLFVVLSPAQFRRPEWTTFGARSAAHRLGEGREGPDERERQRAETRMEPEAE